MRCSRLVSPPRRGEWHGARTRFRARRRSVGEGPAAGGVTHHPRGTRHGTSRLQAHRIRHPTGHRGTGCRLPDPAGRRATTIRQAGRRPDADNRPVGLAPCGTPSRPGPAFRRRPGVPRPTRARRRSTGPARSQGGRPEWHEVARRSPPRASPATAALGRPAAATPQAPRPLRPHRHHARRPAPGPRQEPLAGRFRRPPAAPPRARPPRGSQRRTAAGG